MSFVYITCKDKEEAKKISKHLLEKRLIACANIWPISSSFWWNGEIQEEEEFVLMGKTVPENYEKIKEEVKEIHSYTVPCICLLNSEENKEYGDWVKEETKRG